MNEEQLQAIEERVNAATTGQWGIVRANNDTRVWRDDSIIALFPDTMPYYTTAHNSESDAVFCAHAREDVPALLAEVRSLRAKLDAVPVQAMGEMMDAFENEGFPFGYKRQRDAITSWLDAQVQP